MHNRHANKGAYLEIQLEKYHRNLKLVGRADITKKEIRAIATPQGVRFIKHEGFDFSGTILGGRNCCVEAKMCESKRLPIDKNNKSGLHLRQLQALCFNGKLGALVGIIWQYKFDEVYAIGYWQLKKMLEHYNENKGLSIEGAREYGMNICKHSFDYVECLEALERQ